MANYISYIRTNYFGVKDPEAFKAWCDKYNKYGLKMITIEAEDGEILYGFLDENGGGLSSYYYDEETDEESEVDIIEELAQHIAPGWVAEVREVGYEKMLYLVGWTRAVTSEGLLAEISLDYLRRGILEKHPDLKMTSCSY